MSRHASAAQRKTPNGAACRLGPAQMPLSVRSRWRRLAAAKFVAHPSRKRPASRASAAPRGASRAMPTVGTVWHVWHTLKKGGIASPPPHWRHRARRPRWRSLRSCRRPSAWPPWQPLARPAGRRGGLTTTGYAIVRDRPIFRPPAAARGARNGRRAGHRKPRRASSLNVNIC